MNKDIDKNSVKDFLSNLQTKIIEAIQIVDGKNFLIDSWQRTEGGGGTTAILENGNVFERAGIGFSFVTGNKLPKTASDVHPEIRNRKVLENLNIEIISTGGTASLLKKNNILPLYDGNISQNKSLFFEPIIYSNVPKKSSLFTSELTSFNL